MKEQLEVSDRADVLVLGATRAARLHVAKFVISTLQPFRVVENKEFRALFSLSTPSMSAEGARALVGEIFLRLMDQLKSEIAESKERCCGLPFLSICADRWKSESTKEKD